MRKEPSSSSALATDLDRITGSSPVNVSRGMIYLHYVDKYDLLDKLIETHFNELRDRCKASADLDLSTGR